MSSCFDLRRLVPIALVAALAAAGLFMVSRGIGGGGGNEAQQIVERAFASANAPKSGKLSATVTLSLQGAPGPLARPFDVRVQGPFEQPAAGKAPKFDLEMTATGAGQSSAFGAVSTGRRAFVEYEGQAYEVPSSEVDRLRGGSDAKSESAALASLGIDPRQWLRNPTDAGSAQVGGESTTHVSAEIDAKRMVADLQKLAQRSGQATQIPQQVRENFEDAVKDAKLDVYAAKSDGSLRRLVLSARVEVPNPQGGDPIAGSFNLDAQISDVGKPQEISAPKDAAPFSALQAGGLSPFGLDDAGSVPPVKDTQNANGGRGERAGRSRRGRSGQRAATPPVAQRSNAYIGCVQQAQDLMALEKCQALLP